MRGISRSSVGQPRALTVPYARTKPVLPPEALEQYWHPQRFGVIPAPAPFRQELRAFNPRVQVVKSPYHQRWLVWEQNPAVTYRLCPGWSFRFAWQQHDGSYLPLDRRLMYNLWLRDFRRVRPMEYFDRIESEILREAEAHRAHTDASVVDRRRDWLQYRRIKNIGRGNKFALHHDGSIVPSAGEVAWRRERERTLGLPVE